MKSLTFKARPVVAVAVSLTIACAASVAQEGTIRKVMDIVRTETPPQVDGRLDEPVWQLATVIADLHQYDPLEHGVPSETSIFYVLYDDENLYIGARLLDSEPSLISARQMVQGQSVDVDDRIEVILDPLQQHAYGLQVSAQPERRPQGRIVRPRHERQ